MAAPNMNGRLHLTGLHPNSPVSFDKIYIFIKQIYQKNLALDNLNLPTFPIVDFFQNGDLLLSGLVANQVVTGRGNISTPLQFIQDPCFGDDGFNEVFLV